MEPSVKLESRKNQTLQELHYRELIDSVNGIVWEYDCRSGKFTFVSKKAEAILGYPIDVWTSQPHFWESLIHSEDREWAVSFCKNETLEGRDHEFEYRMVAKDGRIVWIRDIINLVRDAPHLTLQGIMVDVTKTKVQEYLLQKQSEELLRSNRSLQRFAYIASHDLKEPLRTITCYVELLKREMASLNNSSALEFANYAITGAAKANRLVDDLLLYSRVGAETEKFQLIECKVLVQEVIEHLKASISNCDAKITVGDLPSVTAIYSQLVQVFMNLIGNALKFHGSRPLEIQVGVESGNNAFWTFNVSDNGTGFDPKHANQIFELFYRLGGEQYPGSGLGLAICKQIIEFHGGTIWAESTPNVGSTFRFTLPNRSLDSNTAVVAAEME